MSEAPGGGAIWPCRCSMSGRLTPAAATRMRISPGPGVGQRPLDQGQGFRPAGNGRDDGAHVSCGIMLDLRRGRRRRRSAGAASERRQRLGARRKTRRAADSPARGDESAIMPAVKAEGAGDARCRHGRSRRRRSSPRRRRRARGRRGRAQLPRDPRDPALAALLGRAQRALVMDLHRLFAGRQRDADAPGKPGSSVGRSAARAGETVAEIIEDDAEFDERGPVVARSASAPSAAGSALENAVDVAEQRDRRCARTAGRRASPRSRRGGHRGSRACR